MSVIPGGSNPSPEGDLGFAQSLEWLRGIDEDYVKNRIRVGVQNQASEARDTFFNEVLAAVGNILETVNLLTKAITNAVSDFPTVDEALDHLNDWGRSLQSQVQGMWDDIVDLNQRWQDIIGNVTDAAVDAIVDGVSGIGQWAQRLSDAVWGFVDRTINAIFGDGGTKWAQEMLLASSPVTLGFNDLPLGFILPYPATIDNVILRTLEHSGSGRIRIHFRVNGVDRNTIDFNAGQTQREVNNMNIQVNKGDVITLWVSEASSDCANLSCAVWGRYR